MMSSDTPQLRAAHPPKFFPVIHLSPVPSVATTQQNLVDNCAIAVDAGADGLFFINQNVSTTLLLRHLRELRESGRFAGVPMGINLLDRLPHTAMHTAAELGLDLVWSDRALPDVLCTTGRGHFGGIYFGGVGFKYQDALPDSEVAGAIRECEDFVDYITTSGPATGSPPTREKLDLYADAIAHGARGSRGRRQKLAVASGMSADNLEELVLDEKRPNGVRVDAVLVASSIESSFGHLDLAKTHAMGAVFRAIRNKLGGT